MSDPIQELLDLEKDIRLSQQEIFRQAAEGYRKKIRFLERKIVRLSVKLRCPEGAARRS